MPTVTNNTIKFILKVRFIKLSIYYFMWSIVRWFYNLFSSLGFYNKKGSILLLGLDNAGKTTLVHTLKNDRLSQPAPTQHATREDVVVGNVTFTCNDVGGHGPARRIWPSYFTSCDLIVFIVDSSDTERLPEARQELDLIINTRELSHKPILVLGNKTDRPDSLSEQSLRQYLGIYNDEQVIDTNKNRPVKLFTCSVTSGYGYQEGFTWLSQFL